jgi:hypothetical protein
MVAMDSLALFTLADLKLHCKLGAEESGNDAQLVVLGNAASAYCEERVGERFRIRDYTLVRNGDGRSLLLRLPRPIAAVTSLTIDDVAIDAADYVVFADSGKVQLKGRTFTPGVGNVAIVLSAGYAETAPRFRQVRAAALDLAKSHYDEWSANAISISSISMGPASTVIRPGLNPRIEKYLDSIRDVRG